MNVEEAKPPRRFNRRGGRFGGRGGRRLGRGRGGFYGRRPRGQSQTNRVPFSERPKSTTTLFVDNLPFSFKDEELKEIFKDFNPVSANVIIKFGRSLGFGFVEFENEETQKKALEAIHGFEASSERGPRKLTVLIAMERRQRDNTEQQEETPTGTTTTETAESTA